MVVECNECQSLLETERPPVICPVCGLAGVTYGPVDEMTLAQHVAEGDGPLLLDAEAVPEEPLVEVLTFQVYQLAP